MSRVPTLEDIANYNPSNGGLSDDRERVDTSEKDLAVITPQVWSAFSEANNPPTVFRYGGVPTRIERGDNGEPITRMLNYDRMCHELARKVQFTDWKRQGEELVERAIAPPKAIVNDVLATPNPPLPILNRIVEAPVFAPNGTLQTEPGYHEASRTYYAPQAGFRLAEVPKHPTGLDVEHARETICTELLGDFPFVSESELAHAAGLLLLPFARDLINGSTPLHLIDKPTPGSGATLLVDSIAWPSLGRAIPTMTEGRDEDEWRKRLTSKLRGSPTFVFIDNLRRRLDSAAVASTITSPMHEDRILGISEMVHVPVRCAWVASGNNAALSSEITRRTLRVRLDPRVDRPWLRTGFRHADLRTWVRENRALLVWSALTLIQAWIDAGQPPGSRSLGMFEDWARVIGGILDVARIPGFLENLDDFYDESDAEGQQWRGFLTEWWHDFESADVRVADLWQIATREGCLSLGDGKEQSQRVVLGRMLSEKRDRVYEIPNGTGNIQVTIKRAGELRRATLWRLHHV